MPRHVLCLSSQVAFGTVGLAASTPALHAAGFTALPLPTIILSNHPGLGKPAGVRLPAVEIAAMLQRLSDLGVLSTCSGVLTGYFASADQVEATAHAIAGMRAANPNLYVLVDPVLGDGASLYVAAEVAEAIRDRLVPLASGLTPNRFELAWLSGRTVITPDEAIAAARSLNVGEVLATSIPVSAAELATLVVEPAADFAQHSERLEGVPHGTGDFLSGLYLGCRLNGLPPSEALRLSSAILQTAIIGSQGAATLDVIGSLEVQR
jgi:pyridoxine kinase